MLLNRAFLTVFLIVFLLSQGSYAQDYLFRVLANKGQNQVVKSGSTQGISLKTGAKLFSGDKIITVQGSYIGLVHRSGKTMEIRSAGQHPIDELEGKLNVGSAGVAGRYMSFVLSKMNEDQQDVNSNYRSNLNATGAVSRATGNVAIRLLLKEQKNPNLVLGDRATINWQADSQIEKYLITVKNIFGQDLFIVETSGTKFEIDFNHQRLSNERFILVNVMSKDDQTLKSADYAIKRLSPTEGEQLMAQLIDLKSQIGEESSLNKLIYASFYEANNLFLEAHTKYQEAMEISPEISDFKQIYEDFVISNGLGN